MATAAKTTRAPKPDDQVVAGETLASVRVPVGPYRYYVKLVRGPITFKGKTALGICDSNAQRILISDRQTPARRRTTFWHEYAHAWAFDLDPSDSSFFTYEMLSNLVGLGMARMNPALLAKIEQTLSGAAAAELGPRLADGLTTSGLAAAKRKAKGGAK